MEKFRLTKNKAFESRQEKPQNIHMKLNILTNRPGKRETAGDTLALILIVTLAAIFRVLCSFSNEFWLDEIWSIKGVSGLAGIGGVFTDFISDNNHPLNSIYLFFINKLELNLFENLSYLICRSLSILCGTLSVLLAYRLGNRFETKCGRVFCLITALSYIQILYSSEARGYAGAVFASLLSADILLGSRDRLFITKMSPRDDRASKAESKTSQSWTVNPELGSSYIKKISIILLLTSALGLLSHLSYYVFLVSVTIWFVITKDKRDLFKRVLLLIKVMGPSLMLAAILYLNFYRHLSEGSGALGDKTIFILNTISAIFGGPALSVNKPISAVIVVGLLLLFVTIVVAECLRVLKKQDQPALLCFLIAIPVPLVLYYIYAPRVIYPRYFLISITFFLALCAKNLVRLSRTSLVNRVISTCILLGFLINSGIKTYELVVWGRGRPIEAIKLIDSLATSSVTEISAQQDVRAFDSLKFYEDGFQKTRPQYVANRAYPTEWYIVESQDPFENPMPIISPYASHRHCLVGGFNSAELSGFRWFIYRDCEKQGGAEFTGKVTE